MSENGNKLTVPTIVVTAMLAVVGALGTYTYKTLADDVHDVRAAVGALTIDVAMLKSDMKRLETETDSRTAKIEIMSDKLSDVARAVDDLKHRGGAR